MKNIHYLSQHSIENKRVIIRLDCDVPIKDGKILDDFRIRANIATINYLLERGNKLVCIAKLGRPEGRDPKFSLKPVADHLNNLLDGPNVKIVDDFLTEDPSTFSQQNSNEILLLENIRFYEEEEQNNPEFTKELAKLGEIYVNDAFAMCHRNGSSVVGLAELLPSYAGIQLEKEITALGKVFGDLEKPVVVIIGGAKIDTKIKVIGEFLSIADQIIIGGGLANTFMKAQGAELGTSLFEENELETARTILAEARERNVEIVLPTDAVLGSTDPTIGIEYVKKIDTLTPEDTMILDIGPETEANYGNIISHAKTVIWNGPMGLIEKPQFEKSTDFIYYSLTNNVDALTIIGGGDTLSAISDERNFDKIDHISTGGGAMLEFIEKKGLLPGLESLRR